MIEGVCFCFNDEKLRVSCANCQLVCCPDKDERKARHKMLTESGVVLQNSDGSLEAVSPKNAKEKLASLSVPQRALYQDT